VVLGENPVIYTVADNLTFTAIGRYSDLGAETTPQDFNLPPGPNSGLCDDRMPLQQRRAVDGQTTAKKRSMDCCAGDLEMMGAHASRIPYNLDDSLFSRFSLFTCRLGPPRYPAIATTTIYSIAPFPTPRKKDDLWNAPAN